MQDAWRILLLGGLQAERRGRLVSRFRTQKTAALLAYLVYFCERSHPREVLIEMLWPGCEPTAGRHNLRTALSALRHQFEAPGLAAAGAVLRADHFSVQINPSAVRTDVADFEAALEAAGVAAHDEERVQRLLAAVALYRGELLPGYYQDWILTEQRRLGDLFFRAVRRLAAHFETAGAPEKALEHVRRAADLDPFREEIQYDLMRLLAAAGQPSAALRQFEELKRLLREELDAEPSPALVKLASMIQSSKARTATPPPLPMPAAPPASRMPTGIATFLLLELPPALRSEGAAARPPEESASPPASQSRPPAPREAPHAEREAYSNPLEAPHAEREVYSNPLDRTIQKHHGQTISRIAGTFGAAFESPSQALACAIECHPLLPEPPARMALDTREVKPARDESPGWLFRRALGLLHAARPGQILCSESTAALLRGSEHPEATLCDLGYYRLQSIDHPEPVFAVQYAGMASPVSSRLNAIPAHTGSLPAPVTAFFGRLEELDWLQAVLPKRTTRLVTLTGAGGCGKTRLGLEAARLLFEPLHGAVWFVDLQNLTDARLLPVNILDALQVERAPGGEPLQQAVELLSQQRSLLLLDNFEHLVEDGAAIVRSLLQQAPALTCLITSRRSLRIEGEKEYGIMPLPTPNGETTPEALMRCPAVELFVDRAQAVCPEFRLAEDNAAVVAELCYRLEGIPLALELAASRIQTLTPAQMLAELEHRFDFLVSRRRDIVRRHRTMQAAIAWSYDALAPALQRFFARLSVFRGGWSAEAAARVCGEPRATEALACLREESLILGASAATHPPTMRFRMLDTLREFADAQLAPEERAEARRQHAAFFLEFVEAIEARLAGPQQGACLDRLEQEHDNWRAALDWCKTDAEAADVGLRLAAALAPFWTVRAYAAEGRVYLRDLLARHQDSGPMRPLARALEAAGNLAAEEGDMAAAREDYEAALTLYRQIADGHGMACSLNNLGLVARSQGDGGTARALFEESLARHREGRSPRGMAMALSNLGALAMSADDYAAADEHLSASIEILETLGDESGLAAVLNNLADVSRFKGDLAAAQLLYAQAHAINRRLGNRNWEATNLYNLGAVACAAGDPAAALSLLQEALTIWRRLGNRRGITHALEVLAAVCAGQNQADNAARFCGAAAALRQATGATLGPAERQIHERTIASALELLGDAVFEQRFEAGRNLPLDEAIAQALAGPIPTSIAR